jgi:hypothetical protein
MFNSVITGITTHGGDSMTKVVIREIKRCNQCPYIFLSAKDYCLHGDKPRILNTTQWIPSWCPLQDKEENAKFGPKKRMAMKGVLGVV